MMTDRDVCLGAWVLSPESWFKFGSNIKHSKQVLIVGYMLHPTFTHLGADERLLISDVELRLANLMQNESPFHSCAQSEVARLPMWRERWYWIRSRSMVIWKNWTRGTLEGIPGGDMWLALRLPWSVCEDEKKGRIADASVPADAKIGW